MAKQKQKYKKVNLYSNKINGKRVIIEKKFSPKKFEQREKDFINEIDNDKIKQKGIIVDVDLQVDNQEGKVVFARLRDEKLEFVEKIIPSKTYNTNGIGMWGDNGYKSFYPAEQDSSLLLGEEVKFELKNGVVLQLSSLAERVENLCLVLEYIEDEQYNNIQEKVENVIKQYIVTVANKYKLLPEDKEYIYTKLNKIKSLSPKDIPNAFREVKKILKQKIDIGFKMCSKEK